MGLGPAQVHAHQHLGPVLRLGTPGPGMNLEETIIGVGLTGEQAFDLELGGAVTHGAQGRLGLGGNGRVAFLLGHFQEFQIVVQFGFETGKGLELGFKACTVAHDRLSLGRIGPQVRVLGLGVERRQRLYRIVPVKDTSSADRRTAWYRSRSPQSRLS